jgi:hypothetical protein
MPPTGISTFPNRMTTEDQRPVRSSDFLSQRKGRALTLPLEAYLAAA